MSTPSWTLDLAWWVTAVELPALAGLFWLTWRARQEADHATDVNRDAIEAGLSDLREALAAYKLEVAKSYASLAHLKDVEHRLTRHLVRIEDKLDAIQHVAPHGAGGHR